MKSNGKVLERFVALHKNSGFSVRSCASRQTKRWRQLKRGLFLTLALMLYWAVSPSPSCLICPAVQAAQIEQRRNADPTPTPTPASDNSIFSSIFQTQPGTGQTQPGTGHPHPSRAVRVIQALISFALAAFLAACLAFRPRKNLPLFQRNPFVIQTQILLAVVGAALMIVVADNSARAFGIFAAASLIRFRTNISDPKETSVLLVSLAIGLASGIGRWEIAIALTLFLILLLWPLERFELSHVMRAMELKVKTHSLNGTDAALQKIFKRHGINAELRKLDPEDEKHPHGVIHYHLDLHPEISLDRLSEEIFTAAAEHIESVQWQQKKSSSYIYR
jgi:hypothetical protein